MSTFPPPTRYSKTGEHGPKRVLPKPSGMDRLRQLTKLSVDATQEQVLNDTADLLEKLLTQVQLEIAEPSPSDAVRISGPTKKKKELLSV